MKYQSKYWGVKIRLFNFFFSKKMQNAFLVSYSYGNSSTAYVTTHERNVLPSSWRHQTSYNLLKMKMQRFAAHGS